MIPEYRDLILSLMVGGIGVLLYLLLLPRRGPGEVLFFVLFAVPAAAVYIFSPMGSLRAWHLFMMLVPVVFLTRILQSGKFSAILKR